MYYVGNLKILLPKSDEEYLGIIIMMREQSNIYD